MVSTYLDLDTNMLYDSGYASSTSPASYTSMSPSQSSQDGPCIDIQSLQLSQAIVHNDFGMESVDLKYEYTGLNNTTNNRNNNVQLKIIEQPQSKFRFRYESEMHGTHGSLMGEKSSKSKKTYPTVELKGFNGNAMIRCRLFQINKSGLHSHRLVFRQNDRDIPDPHDLDLNSKIGYQVKFQGMGIIHTAKRDITRELQRKMKELAEFEIGRELNYRELLKLNQEAELEAKAMNLNQVVLRFEAYEKIEAFGKINLRQLCEPIYSNPISNMKCALTGELKITRMSACISSASGDDDLFLFVEKVGKKNIKVVFFEMDEDDVETWKAEGKFSETDVHHQYAIALKTPPYKDQDIEKTVNVFIRLERPSDGECSAALAFKYKPRECASSRKRARISSSRVSSSELPTTISDTSGLTISEEFDKNNFLNNLISTNVESFDKYLDENLRTNSDELLDKLFDPPLFTDGDVTQMDCAGFSSASSSRKYSGNRSINTKTVIEQIERFIRSSKQKNVKSEKISSYLKAFLTKMNDKYEDLLHAIIRNLDIKSGIKLLTIVHDFELEEILKLKNDFGNNCLHVAAECKAHAFIRPLIKLGADPNEPNKVGKTALHAAVESGCIDCIKKILDKESYINGNKLNIDLTDDNGFTPLHLAIKKSNLEIVKLLCEKGKPSLKIGCTKNGNNAIHLAIEHKSLEILEYLSKNENFKSALESPNLSEYAPLKLAQSMGVEGKIFQGIILKNEEKLSLDQLSIKSDPDSYSSTMSTSTMSTRSRSTSESDDDLSIKSLKIDEDAMSSQEEDVDLDENDKIAFFNDVAIGKLTHLLKKNEKWKKLCKYLSLHSYMCLWNTPESMFNYINECSNIKKQDVIDALNALDEKEAADFVKRNI